MNTNFDKQLVEDMEWVKEILPASYVVSESVKLGSIHCVSPTGIPDGSRWGSDIFPVIQAHFGERFQEVYHNTCYNHVDFTIYLKPINQHI